MYDSIIIGCGPAGMTAAIYLARAGKKVLILEKETIGGQISSSPLVENYPGFISISGSELTSNMYDQIVNFNVDVEIEEVIKIENGTIKKIYTDNKVYETRTIIIATGTSHRLLGIENEKELIGSGIHFCVSCDGAFYKDKNVAVIGGGNSGVIDAIYLSNIAKKVYVIQNFDHLTAENHLMKELQNKNNVEIMLSSGVTKIYGKDSLEGIDISQNKKNCHLDIEGLFLAIGLKPQNEFIKGIIDQDSSGYIISEDTKTNVEGIYVCGDCRTKDYRQVTTAVSDGTIAASNAIKYLQ